MDQGHKMSILVTRGIVWGWRPDNTVTLGCLPCRFHYFDNIILAVYFSLAHHEFINRRITEWEILFCLFKAVFPVMPKNDLFSVMQKTSTQEWPFTHPKPLAFVFVFILLVQRYVNRLYLIEEALTRKKHKPWTTLPKCLLGKWQNIILACGRINILIRQVA